MNQEFESDSESEHIQTKTLRRKISIPTQEQEVRLRSPLFQHFTP